MLDLYPIPPRISRNDAAALFVSAARGDRVRRLEQRAVAFICMAVAVIVILLITLWGLVF
jgi:hypothetical protein